MDNGIITTLISSYTAAFLAHLTERTITVTVCLVSLGRSRSGGQGRRPCGYQSEQRHTASPPVSLYLALKWLRKEEGNMECSGESGVESTQKAAAVEYNGLLLFP